MRTVGIICTIIARLFALLVLAAAGIGWAKALGWGSAGVFWLGWTCTLPVVLPVVLREVMPRHGPRGRE